MDIKSLIPPISEKKKAGRGFIILGCPKIGKTILACSSSYKGFTLVLNFENRLNHIDENENLRFYPFDGRLCTMEDLRKLIINIQSLGENHGVANIVIDTIDSMFTKFEREILAINNKKSLGFDLRKEVNNPIIDSINFFKEKGINVIVTCHLKEAKASNKYVFALANDLSISLNNFIDDIFFLTKGEESKRILWLHGNENVDFNEVSLPLEKKINVPQFIEEPTWEKVMQYYV